MKEYDDYERMTTAQMARAIRDEDLESYAQVVREAAPAGDLPNVTFYRLARALAITARAGYRMGWNERTARAEQGEAAYKRLWQSLSLLALFAGAILGVLIGRFV